MVIPPGYRKQGVQGCAPFLSGIPDSLLLVLLAESGRIQVQPLSHAVESTQLNVVATNTKTKHVNVA